MGIKTQDDIISISKIIKIIDKVKTDYCNDCLYSWCNKRAQVTFCTQKNKGFFECKSCMIKLLAKN